MSESINLKENKEFQFDNNDLSPLELLMMGGSTEIVIDGKRIFFNSEALQNLLKDTRAMEVILTPVNLLEGKKTLEQIQEARSQRKDSAKMGLFAFRISDEYIQKDIRPILKLGDLGENGKVSTFGVYFLQKGEKFNLSEEDAQKEIKFEGGLGKITKHTGNIDGIAQYKINVGGGK